MRGPLVLLVLCLAAAAAVAGCGGSEEVQPRPETVEGTVPADTGGGEDGGETTDTGETETGESGGDGGGEGDAEAGKSVFASAGCGGCHTFEDAGTAGTIGPNLDEAQPDMQLAVERVTNGGNGMPPFKDQLSEEEIRNVATYVVEASGG